MRLCTTAERANKNASVKDRMVQKGLTLPTKGSSVEPREKIRDRNCVKGRNCFAMLSFASKKVGRTQYPLGFNENHYLKRYFDLLAFGFSSYNFGLNITAVCLKKAANKFVKRSHVLTTKDHTFLSTICDCNVLFVGSNR